MLNGIQQSIDAPRFRHDGDRVAIESAGSEVRAALGAMGHTIVEGSGSYFGGSQAIVRLTRGYAAGSDLRRDGMAAGY